MNSIRDLNNSMTLERLEPSGNVGVSSVSFDVRSYGMDDGLYSVAVGDLNGDSLLDLVTANYSPNTVSVLIITDLRTRN